MNMFYSTVSMRCTDEREMLTSAEYFSEENCLIMILESLRKCDRKIPTAMIQYKNKDKNTNA